MKVYALQHNREIIDYAAAVVVGMSTRTYSTALIIISPSCMPRKRNDNDKQI